MRRRVVMLGVLALVILAAVVTLALSRPKDESSRRVEGWVAQQLKIVARRYIEPEIDFDAISYVKPTGIKLTNFRMTASDTEGLKHDVITAAEATIELAGIPRLGQPVVIRQLRLIDPTVRLIALSEYERRFVGFSQLIKPVVDSTTDDGASFELRRVSWTNGRLLYNPRIQGTTPLILDQINSDLVLTDSGEGLLTIDLEINRDAVVEMVLKGVLDLKGVALREANLTLGLSLDRHDRSLLPPQLQVLLDRFGIEGELNLRASGDVPLLRTVDSELAIHATLTSGRAIIAGIQPTIDRLDLGARVDRGTIWVDQLVATAIGGSVDFAGSLRMDSDDLTASGRLTLIDLDLSQLESMTSLDDRLAGVVAGRLVLVEAPVARLRQPGSTLPASWGSGMLELTDVRALRVPVLSSVVDQLTSLMTLSAGDPRSLAGISMNFELTDAGVAFRSMEYSSPLIAGRGSGTMGLDGGLDLRINAGPLERVQGELGAIGRAMGSVTDRIGGYRVTGTVREPEVRPMLFGQ